MSSTFLILSNKGNNTFQISSNKLSENYIDHKVSTNALEIVISDNKYIRKDRSGNTIKKGGKLHKITFIDNFKNVNFYEIVEIDSYKAYNIDISKNLERDDISCSCMIY